MTVGAAARGEGEGERARSRPRRYDTYSTAPTLGTRAVAVATRASLASVETGTRSRSLTTTLSAHHTLATLSSKSPRAKGKMRCSAWRKVESEERNGAKRTRKVAVTVRARLMKSEVLRSGRARPVS